MKSKGFCDGKSNREFGAYPIDGKPIMTLSGMIYWYGWGDEDEFDIRVVRRILGLPEEQPKIDYWFMAKRPNRCKAYGEACKQIRIELESAGRSFVSVLEDHDRIISEDSQMFIPAPKADDDFPF